MRNFSLVLLTCFIFSCSSNVDEISRESFEGEWPFTVESGTIGCENGMIYFKSGVNSYALNGNAKQKFEDVESILITPESPEQLPVSIGDVLEYGKKMCK